MCECSSADVSLDYKTDLLIPRTKLQTYRSSRCRKLIVLSTKFIKTGFFLSTFNHKLAVFMLRQDKCHELDMR